MCYVNEFIEVPHAKFFEYWAFIDVWTSDSDIINFFVERAFSERFAITVLITILWHIANFLVAFTNKIDEHRTWHTFIKYIIQGDLQYSINIRS